MLQSTQLKLPEGCVLEPVCVFWDMCSAFRNVQHTAHFKRTVNYCTVLIPIPLLKILFS